MYLEVQVGVLPSGDLVLVDVGVAGLHGGGAVEGRVQPAGHLPVLAVVEDALQRDACREHTGQEHRAATGRDKSGFPGGDGARQPASASLERRGGGGGGTAWTKSSFAFYFFLNEETATTTRAVFNVHLALASVAAPASPSVSSRLIRHSLRWSRPTG